MALLDRAATVFRDGARSFDARSRRLVALGLVAIVATVLVKILRAGSLPIAPVLDVVGRAPQESGLARSFHGLFHELTASSLAGAFAIHLASRPRRRDLVATLVVGPLLAALNLLTERDAPDALGAALALASGLGLASLCVLAVRALLTPLASRAEVVRPLVAAALMPVCFATFPQQLALTAILHPRTLDTNCWIIEVALGTPPVVFFGRVLARAPWLVVACQLVYNAVPALGALLCALQDRTRERAPTDFATAFVAVTLAGVALYHFFPVVGPMFLLTSLGPDALVTNQSFVLAGHFQTSPPPLAALLARPFLAPPAVWRNCMPSLHTSWALLICWHAWAHPRRAIRAAGVITLALMVIATLGFALHYTVDLIVAVPFTLAIQAACTTSVPWLTPSRYRAVAAGTVLVAGWLAAVLLAPSLPQLPAALWWAGAGLTIGSTFYLWRALLGGARASIEPDVCGSLETDGPRP